MPLADDEELVRATTAATVADLGDEVLDAGSGEEALRLVDEGGRIIAIGSNTAERTAFPGAGVHPIIKAAVAVLVRGAAIGLAPRGIAVNNVQPGPTLTDVTADLAEQSVRLIPLDRMGELAEIAGLVAYLAGAEAAFVTGSSMTIDGGYLG